LGLLEDSRYREERITLAHGDTVLVYSDGAIEMCDRRGEELGLTALLACLQAVPGVAPDLDAVPEALLRRSACIRQPDDLTLLTLTRH
jgi:serine phosphatase RsbU (regulator of sigma subunit)